MISEKLFQQYLFHWVIFYSLYPLQKMKVCRKDGILYEKRLLRCDFWLIQVEKGLLRLDGRQKHKVYFQFFLIRQVLRHTLSDSYFWLQNNRTDLWSQKRSCLKITLEEGECRLNKTDLQRISHCQIYLSTEQDRISTSNICLSPDSIGSQILSMRLKLIAKSAKDEAVWLYVTKNTTDNQMITAVFVTLLVQNSNYLLEDLKRLSEVFAAWQVF